MTVVIAIALTAGLWALHLRVRRHAGWTTCAAGRTYILSAYPLAAIAAYWLAASDWVLGSTLSLAAAAAFAAGSSALKRVAADHARLAAQWETIEPATGSLQV
ncbi:hypothetical protein PDG61_26400 [Mycolicibacterium sp. BiH015]|uniref:hypothetical protein n=1 Tax=Mycolicibacterium sp. BiH015 TaxID=3018808 RepID=UPI0022E48340|nr:hypothetical protein [Mycolicibacterium sp. BiH015]MDA2894466.1 hypothetical protein [Mycolicibacterium sp. BiH015]